MFISNGILFNHESPRRGTEFVTRKITKGICDIVSGRKKTPIMIGNLDAKRDWGFAKDYVDAMWLIMQADKCDDWVVATGEVHTVREVIELSMNKFGIPYEWVTDTNGLEKLVNKSTGDIIIQQCQQFMRPNDVTYLCGDSTKIRTQLGWKPTVTFEELIYQMIDTDI
jgi:GDPmannose 4,6-dehydratase